MAPRFESCKVRRFDSRGLRCAALGILSALLIVGVSGCYKNEENRKEEKFEQKKEQAAEQEKAAEKEEKAEAPEKAETGDESAAKSSLDSYAKAVAEAAQEANAKFFKENLIDPSILSGCRAVGDAAPDPIEAKELKKLFTETDRKAAIESFDEDLAEIESQKIIEIFKDMKTPAHYHGELEASSEDATCAVEASATVETAVLIDHKDEDIARHITELLYDGNNWRIVGHQSVRVDCDDKPMARTKACQAFQAMEM